MPESNDGPTDDHNHNLPWAFGYDRFGNDELPNHLLRIAKHHAKNAISKSESSTPTAWLESAVHAGSALEIFSKFLLARENPVLILDLSKTKDRSLFHAIGRSEAGGASRAMNLMTRSPESSLEAIALLWSDGVDVIKQGCARRVLNARNAAVHLGLLDRAELQTALVEFADIMKELIRLSEIDADEFWGTHRSRIESLTDAKALHNNISEKIKRSRTVSLTLPPEDSAYAYMEESATSDNALFDVEDYPEGTGYWYGCRCPGCRRVGKMFCARWISEPAREYDGDMFVHETAHPVEYRCETCDLTLDGRELRQLNMDGIREIDFRPITPEESTTFEEHRQMQFGDDDQAREL